MYDLCFTRLHYVFSIQWHLNLYFGHASGHGVISNDDDIHEKRARHVEVKYITNEDCVEDPYKYEKFIEGGDNSKSITDDMMWWEADFYVFKEVQLNS